MISTNRRFHPWDVVIVPFPYAEKQQSTVRPGVVVSARRLHDRTRMYYVAMITSAQKVATFDESAIFRAIGSLPEEDRGDVLGALRRFFADH